MDKNNMKGYDELKTAFEKNFTEFEVVSVMDLNNKFAVVTCQTKGKEDEIPGPSFKIDKKTGDLSIYNPMADFAEYRDAVKNRCKVYKEPHRN